MEEQILFEVYEAIKKGDSVALAIITEDSGSSPRKKGSTMAVFKDGRILGSVGGGKVELTVIERAKEAIEKKESTTFDYKLNEDGLGMVCGGAVKGYIKIFTPKQRLIIVGGGHIGKQLNKIAQILNFYTVVFDDRLDYKDDESLKSADELIVGSLKENLFNFNFNKEDFVVIVTKGHLTDKEALKAVADEEVSYIGMIGSAKKIRTIMGELISEGVSEERLRKVYAPMGLDIASSLPEEIAVGILSEILLIKNNGSLKHKSEIKSIWD